MRLILHQSHVVNVLLEHMLPILEQLVVLLVMQDTILILEQLNVQLAHEVITLQVQDQLHVPVAQRAITHLVLDPYNVIFVLQALTLLQDQLVVLNAQQEAIQNKLEVLNVLIVQLGDLHQELDQQVVNCVLQEPILQQQDQPSVLNVMKEVLPVKKVVMSVSLALLELIL